MSEPKMSHTPGPWELSKVPTSVGHCYRIGPFHACLYVDNRSMHEDQTMAANARLIAAAPELLEACIAALNLTNSNTQRKKVGNLIRAAIAKAQGGNSNG